MDIVERLGELRLGDKEYDVVVDAINKIELLRKERDGLREALRRLAETDLTGIARDALKEGE